MPRAVGAHDRVDLALADGQVDALEDLVLGRGDGRDAQAADDEVLVGGGLVGHEWVKAPCWWVRGRWAGCAAFGDEVGEGHGVEGAGDGVADADPQEVDRAARAAVAGRGVLRVVGGADHRGDRAFERAQDVAHGDRSGARASS